MARHKHLKNFEETHFESSSAKLKYFFSKLLNEEKILFELVDKILGFFFSRKEIVLQATYLAHYRS